MDWLNYHHLLYFWTVVKEGSIAKAGLRLKLAQPTISGQLRALETSVGEKLLVRSGRNLTMTDAGRVVFRYADEIFTIGGELGRVIKDRLSPKRVQLVVGITDAMPKLIAFRLLEPLMRLSEPVKLLCQEGTPERLFAELDTHALDLVLSDVPLSPGGGIRAFCHSLGESGLSILGNGALADRCKENFPDSLNGAPFFLQSERANLRISLLSWFSAHGMAPQVIGEFDDSALLKTFCQTGTGLIAMPTVIEEELLRQYDLRVVGRLPEVREHFYAISMERRIRHPAVSAIVQGARAKIEAETKKPRT